MDEAKLSEQRLRGDAARAILENPLFNEAFDAIEREITTAWKQSPADGERERNNAYLMQRLLANLKEQFKRHVSTGAMAEKELLKLKEKSKIRRLIGNG